MSFFYERETVEDEPRWGKLPMRLRWVMKQRGGWRAQARCFWHMAVRGYAYEVCDECGRPVGPHTGSWWHAPDELWEPIIGDPAGVVCPPCFTRLGDEAGIRVCWKAARDA